MLRITAPHVQLWNAWYADFGNRPEGIAPLRERVDAACRAAGREPGDVERSVAILIGLAGGGGRMQGDRENRRYDAARGSSDDLAELLRAYAREGIGHIQLVLDPITLASIEEVAPVLELLDRG
jgi:alkanesulfonate monooxygenase SsuD/methylene tetrahydromethanopterin reductase-like flavin-dependent oxidoreductase (luciferase family)